MARAVGQLEAVLAANEFLRRRCRFLAVTAISLLKGSTMVRILAVM
jgi:hypothetical protein